MYECGGCVTVTGGMKTIEKTGQEPGILSSFAFIVREKEQKIHILKRTCKFLNGRCGFK